VAQDLPADTVSAEAPGPEPMHATPRVTAVGEAFRKRGWRLAAGESCTGGLVLKLLTDLPGSSDFVAGGVVAYSDRVKEAALGVPGEMIRKHGAVSGEVACAMAEGARRLTGADVGIGVTGIAGPGGAVPGKPVGTVWFGVSGPGGVEAERIRFQGSRSEVRERAAERALDLLLRAAERLNLDAPEG